MEFTLELVRILAWPVAVMIIAIFLGWGVRKL